MGVYLPYMDMPISCGWCPLMHGTCEGDECYVGAKITEYQKRPEDCPLLPVPLHESKCTKQSIADIIRAMTDEEMAKTFADNISCHSCPVTCCDARFTMERH